MIAVVSSCSSTGMCRGGRIHFLHVIVVRPLTQLWGRIAVSVILFRDRLASDQAVQFMMAATIAATIFVESSLRRHEWNRCDQARKYPTAAKWPQ